MNNSTNNNRTKPAGPLFLRPWLGPVIAAGLFWFLLESQKATDLERYLALALVAILGGFGWALALGFVAIANREERAAGRMLRAGEDLTERLKLILIDNPWLARVDAVRRAVMPTERELEAFDFHPTYARRLREIREGTSWLIKGGVAHSGPDYRIDPGVRFYQWYRDQLVALQREKFALGVQYQRLQRTLDDREAVARIVRGLRNNNAGGRVARSNPEAA